MKKWDGSIFLTWKISRGKRDIHKIISYFKLYDGMSIGVL
jgi:hypothetical protein